MKHINPSQLQNVIIKDIDEFSEDIIECFGGNATLTSDWGEINISSANNNVSTHEAMAKLSEYCDVKISNIHVIDNHDSESVIIQYTA